MLPGVTWGFILESFFFFMVPKYPRSLNSNFWKKINFHLEMLPGPTPVVVTCLPGPPSAPGTRAPMLTYAKTIYPCLGLTPPTERWDGRPSRALNAHHPPPAHPRSVDIVSRALSCTTQRSAVVAAPLWPGSFQTLGGIVASR